MTISHRLHLLFLPHEKNNHKAFVLQPSFLAVFVALYLLNQSLVHSFLEIKPGVLGYSSEITAEKVFSQTNQERISSGLPPLKYNATLSRAAVLKAEDMFAKNYWAHNSPDGKTPWDFFKTVGYEYSIAGENLAKDFYDTESMMKAWMNSPTHKANILNDQYNEIGIAVQNGVLNGVKTTLVVQHFGHPLNGSLPEMTASEKEFTLRAQGEVPHQYPSVLASTNNFQISPLTISKLFGAAMFVIILIALILDAYITLKNKTHRLSSSSLGHISFLLIIIMLLFFTNQGAIF